MKKRRGDFRRPAALPDGSHRRPKPRFTYVEALQAMQAGVKIRQQLANDPPDKMFKDLRVGINSGMCNQAALVKLMIEKGIITDEEYVAALTEQVNEEVAEYETSLSKELGKDIKLGLPPKE